MKKPSVNLDGVLPVYKDPGMTSHDVVARARRILGMKRIGHTGTLDPMVVGALPLCLGKATRVVEYMQELPKSYEATLILGVATDTEDMTGEVLDRAEPERLRFTEDQIREAAASFIGPIEQVPPMYSAVKVNGKRLYELAREGTVVERKSRVVTIHSIEILRFNLDAELPEVDLRVSCSKGTYIRTLCADIGQKLGVPAAMGSLVRTSTGGISLDRCFTLEEIAEAKEKGTLASMLIPADQAIRFLPELHITAEEARYALQGKTLRSVNGVAELEQVPGLPLVRLYDPAQVFLGLFRIDGDRRTLVPEKVFVPESTGCQES